MEDDEQEDLLMRASSDNEEFTDNEDSFDIARGNIVHEDKPNSCYDKLKFILIGVLLLLSSTALVIMLPLYMEVVNQRGDAYTAILFSCLVTTASLFISGAVFGKLSHNLRDNLCPPFTLLKMLRTGCLYGISCFLIIYATDRKKVMCHLQDPMKGIVLVFSLVFYFFFCKKMMSLQKIFCSTTIIVGLFISVDYGLCDEFRCRGYEREHRKEDAGDWSWQAHSIWSFIYIFGLALWSLHYTLLEGLLIIQGGIFYTHAGNLRLSTVSRLVSTRDTRASITRHSRPLLQISEEDQETPSSNTQMEQTSVPFDHHRQITFMKSPYDAGIVPSAISIALWVHIISLLLILALCWTDMVSFIGKGSGTADFWNTTSTGLLCHFGYNAIPHNGTQHTLSHAFGLDACQQVVMFAWPFVIAYLIFTLSSVHFLILSESSVFTVATTTASLPVSGIWWSVIRMIGLKEGHSSGLVDWYPLVTGELICSVLGLPIVLVGLGLLCKAHFKERSYGKLTVTCFRRRQSSNQA